MSYDLTTQSLLADALNGLMAYDTGATDSGIHNERLRQDCIERLREMDEEEFRFTLSRIVRDAFLSEDALQYGYGIEDAAEFIRWLGNSMDCDLR